MHAIYPISFKSNLFSTLLYKMDQEFLYIQYNIQIETGLNLQDHPGTYALVFTLPSIEPGNV